MTFQTTNKSLPVPDDGQDDWDDEIQQCFTQIDTYLKGIGETSISKAQADLESLSIGSSVNIADSGNLVIGTDGDLSIVYSPTSNTSKVTDTQSGDVLFELPHGASSGPIVSDRNITMKDGPVASESYADATASTTANAVTNESAITPTSVDTGDITSTSIDSTTVDTTEFTINSNAVQFAVDNYVVPVGAGIGLNNAINITTSVTPIQDAIDVLSTAGVTGTVLLPPTEITEDGPITLTEGISIRGWGAESFTTRTEDRTTTTIKIQQTGTTGLIIDLGGARCGYCTLDGFELQGQGMTATAANAIEVISTQNLHVGEISIAGWYGSAIAMRDTTNAGFQQRWERVVILDVDSGDSAAVIDYSNGAGPCIEFGHVWAYPQDAQSTSDSDVIKIFDGAWSVRWLNLGGTLATAVNTNSHAHIGQCNYEPKNNTSAAFAVCNLSGDAPVTVNSLGINGFTMGPNPTRGINLGGTGPANKHIGAVTTKNGATTTDGLVVVANDTGGPNTYGGLSSDVNNMSGGVLTTPVSCLGDLTLVS